MVGKRPSSKEMTNLINSLMGQRVLTEKQLDQIIQGAKRASDRNGMNGVLEYLMKVTQADVDKEELSNFADSVKKNPQMGMEMLEGKRSVPKRKK